MRNRKLLALLFCLALLIGVAVPGTLASAPDNGEDAGDMPVREAALTDTEGETDTPDTGEDADPEEGEPEDADTVDADAEDSDVGDTDSEDTDTADAAAGDADAEESSADAEREKEDAETGDDESEEMEEELTLYERLMASETEKEFWAVVEEAPEEELEALTEEEILAVEEHLRALEPEPAPAVEIPWDPPVRSEIVLSGEGTHDYTWVAPFRGPVTGV